MANFEATTACEPATLTDVAAVQNIIDKYDFNVEVKIEGGVLYVYGDEWFDVFDDNSDDDETTNQFLEEIQPYIEDMLLIQMVGNEKCRYIGAAQVKVTQDNISWRTLDGDDANIRERLQSLVESLHEMADNSDMNKTPDEIETYIWEQTNTGDIVKAAKTVAAIDTLLDTGEALGINVDDKYTPYAALLSSTIL